MNSDKPFSYMLKHKTNYYKTGKFHKIMLAALKC